MARAQRCTGRTKAGTRCKAWALTGTKRCAAHPLSPDSARFGSREQAARAGALGGRPRKPRVVDVLRDRVEAEAELIVEPYFQALRELVLTATYEGDVIASDVPDLPGRITAAEKLLDRVYGKPRQTIEHAGPAEGAPIAVEFALNEKAREAIAGALRTRPAASGE